MGRRIFGNLKKKSLEECMVVKPVRRCAVARVAPMTDYLFGLRLTSCHHSLGQRLAEFQVQSARAIGNPKMYKPARQFSLSGPARRIVEERITVAVRSFSSPQFSVLAFAVQCREQFGSFVLSKPDLIAGNVHMNQTPAYRKVTRVKEERPYGAQSTLFEPASSRLSAPYFFIEIRANEQLCGL